MNIASHAYLVRGTAEQVPALLEELAREGITAFGSPDLLVRTFATLGIDDAHDLRARAAVRGFLGPRVFIVAATQLTTEAQNALLKTLEEPSAGARFFIITPSPDMLLPTVRSRTQMLVLDASETIAYAFDAQQFLAALPARRVELLKPLLEKGEDDPVKPPTGGHGAGLEKAKALGAGKRDVATILDALNAIERVLAAKIQDKEVHDALHALYTLRAYATDRGALQKPLLESIALSLPVI